MYPFYEHLGHKFFGVKKRPKNTADFQRRHFKFVLSSSVKTQQKQTKTPTETQMFHSPFMVIARWGSIHYVFFVVDKKIDSLYQNTLTSK